MPCSPRSARSVCWWTKSYNVDLPGSPMNTTSPPRPPSPPDGPPLGTYFSRRNATQPLPPSPATTFTLHSSMNFIALLGRTLTTRSLHPSHQKHCKDLTEQAEVLLQKPDWRSRGGRSDSKEKCRRSRRSLSGRRAEMADRDLS